MTTPTPTPGPQKWTYREPFLFCGTECFGDLTNFVHVPELLAALNRDGDADTRRLDFIIGNPALLLKFKLQAFNAGKIDKGHTYVRSLIDDALSEQAVLLKAAQSTEVASNAAAHGPIPAPAATRSLCARHDLHCPDERCTCDTEAIECPECKGTGTQNGLVSWMEDIPKCATCKGTGAAPAATHGRIVDTAEFFTPADFRDLVRGKDTTQEGDEMSASHLPWVRAMVGLTNWPPSYRFRRRREPVKPVESEGQTPSVSYAEQAHELVDKLATAMRTREPFTPLILTFAEDIAAPLRAEIARAETSRDVVKHAWAHCQAERDQLKADLRAEQAKLDSLRTQLNAQSGHA